MNLYTQEFIAEIAPEEYAWVWTFSDDPEEPGTVPVPMIRVMVGDTVVIKGAAGFMHVDQVGDWPNHIFWTDPLTLT